MKKVAAALLCAVLTSGCAHTVSRAAGASPLDELSPRQQYACPLADAVLDSAIDRMGSGLPARDAGSALDRLQSRRNPALSDG